MEMVQQRAMPKLRGPVRASMRGAITGLVLLAFVLLPACEELGLTGPTAPFYSKVNRGIKVYFESGERFTVLLVDRPDLQVVRNASTTVDHNGRVITVDWSYTKDGMVPLAISSVTLDGVTLKEVDSYTAENYTGP